MESDKKNIFGYLLFCFHQKKSAVDAELFVRRGENVITVKTCAN